MFSISMKVNICGFFFSSTSLKLESLLQLNFHLNKFVCQQKNDIHPTHFFLCAIFHVCSLDAFFAIQGSIFFLYEKRAPLTNSQRANCFPTYFNVISKFLWAARPFFHMEYQWVYFLKHKNANFPKNTINLYQVWNEEIEVVHFNG